MAKKKQTTSKSSGNKSSGGSGLGIGGILLVLALLCGAYVFGIDISEILDLEGGDTSSNIPVASQGGSGEWYDIYFTNPTCPAEAARVGGLDAMLAEELLATAKTSLDVAAFELNAEPIINALIELAERGVTVRVVVDDEHTAASTINLLRRNGVRAVGDSRSAFMHNKFMVVDQRTVWTGSMNYTTNDVYCNNNNLVRLASPDLARNYTIEFEEMFNDSSFGTTSPRNTTANLTIEGVPVENYFTAEDKPSGRLAEIIGSANQEILFMAFSFTQETIGEAMLERANEGIAIRGVFETTGSQTQYSYFPLMSEAGLGNLQVRQDGNPRVLHHKVIIIDRSIVIFGSYNFSGNAENSNDENIVIIYDTDFASFFIEEFEAVWAEAKVR